MNINKSALTLTLIGAVALLVSVFVLAGGLKGFRSNSPKTISVTGKAERNFTSDLIVWSATFTSESTDLQDAYLSISILRSLSFV